MSGGGIGAIGRRLIRFLISPFVLLVTPALAAGIFLACQSKLPAPLESFAGPEQRLQDGIIWQYRLPIAYYGGPLLARLEYAALPSGSIVSVKSGKAAPAKGYIAGKPDGAKRFLLYPGALAGSGELKVEIATGGNPNSDSRITGGEVYFPKAGQWLIPDPLLWIGLILLGLVLGVAAATLWRAESAARACYATLAVLLVLLVHFFGLEMASRLVGLLPAAFLLLILSAVFRLIVPEKTDDTAADGSS
jgi:hypothetical protein